MLNRWELLDFETGAGIAAEAHLGRGEGWMPVMAPGDTYQALIAAGRLAHPFEGRNEAAAAWVRDREWWWRTTFEAPAPPAGGETLELVFEGLDTFATIYLDGRLLGSTDNMFRRHVFDIGDALGGPGPHTLAIRFDPPALAVRPGDLPVWSAFTDRVSRSKRNLMRKAQFGWGWDWGPDLPTVGVWRPVRIQQRPVVRITDLAFTTLSLNDDTAEARLAVEIDGLVDSSLQLEIVLSDPDGHVVVRTDVGATDAQAIRLTIPEPQLWWTADLGTQPLYEVSVRLFADDRLLDAREQRVGIRTVALDTSPDPEEPGASFFRFVLNGWPMFAKGACWIPPTSFVADVDPVRYRRLIEQAAGANMNMIRVWGGGVYEPDVFYDLCDELGLLVWQDFMFACAHYPDADEAFVTSVRLEVEDQVRRLRNHPCLALWCGNNESQAMHRINADLSGDATPLSGLHIYDDVIPGVLERLDPTTPYWPGSPGGGPNPNSMIAGDVHDWTVWHGVPPIPDAEMQGGFDSSPEGVAYTRYAQDTGRFISEFGIQAAPFMDLLRRWMDPADLVLGSEGFLERVKDEAQKAEAMMIPVTGLPRTLQEYVDFTQWTQAEGLKFGIEHFRRRSPHCSGALIWQFNDCWPCVSWSLVDFESGEKAAYHAVRRAFAPVMASFKSVGDDEWELWVTNDRREPVRGAAIVELKPFHGLSVWSETHEFIVSAGGQSLLWGGHVHSGCEGFLTVKSVDLVFPPNRQLLQPIKRLALDPAVRPQMSIQRLGETRLQIEIRAEQYLPLVRLTSPRADVRYNDNDFGVMAGESRTIIATSQSWLEPSDIQIGNRTPGKAVLG